MNVCVFIIATPSCIIAITAFSTCCPSNYVERVYYSELKSPVIKFLIRKF